MSPCHFFPQKTPWTGLVSNPDLSGEGMATNCLSYCKAILAKSFVNYVKLRFLPHREQRKYPTEESNQRGLEETNGA
jgi:hypothetical protein